MKTLIIYSSQTGNTKLVCEKAFEYINGEKVIIPVKEKDNINLMTLIILLLELG
ncbi:hypothetical protein HMPREF9093_02103 [Fusobacterium sp. oral taxon 370 str. F0437]|nr:hypothetical protein HMPREF9093_02103 [Fusobacterium sp. oral taxon 370 str. F0437]